MYSNITLETTPRYVATIPRATTVTGKYQHGGAPPHLSIEFRDFLNDIWCGRRGFIAWPSESPDLTLPNYFVWAFVKKILYVQ
jgi:hypothetical protein